MSPEITSGPLKGTIVGWGIGRGGPGKPLPVPQPGVGFLAGRLECPPGLKRLVVELPDGRTFTKEIPMFADDLKLTAREVGRGPHLATIGIYLGKARVGEVQIGVGLTDRILALLDGTQQLTAGPRATISPEACQTTPETDAGQ